MIEWLPRLIEVGQWRKTDIGWCPTWVRSELHGGHQRSAAAAPGEHCWSRAFRSGSKADL